MSDRHRAVYVAVNVHQANMMRNLLAQEGIQAYVANDTLNGVHFVPMDWLIRAAGASGFSPTAPQLVVHEDDALRARQILLDAEKTLAAQLVAPELMQLEAEVGQDQGWPLCPQCGKPRLATCPVCHTSATDFDFAFLPEELEGGQVDEAAPRDLMLICSVCDEPFAARFPSLCEWCGFRFADGVEPRKKPTHVTPPAVLAELSGRSGIVLAALILLAAGILGWFNYVLRP